MKKARIQDLRVVPRPVSPSKPVNIKGSGRLRNAADVVVVRRGSVITASPGPIIGLAHQRMRGGILKRFRHRMC